MAGLFDNIGNFIRTAGIAAEGVGDPQFFQKERAYEDAKQQNDFKELFGIFKQMNPDNPDYAKYEQGILNHPKFKQLMGEINQIKSQQTQPAPTIFSNMGLGQSMGDFAQPSDTTAKAPNIFSFGDDNRLDRQEKQARINASNALANQRNNPTDIKKIGNKIYRRDQNTGSWYDTGTTGLLDEEIAKIEAETLATRQRGNAAEQNAQTQQDRFGETIRHNIETEKTANERVRISQQLTDLKQRLVKLQEQKQDELLPSQKRKLELEMEKTQADIDYIEARMGKIQAETEKSKSGKSEPASERLKEIIIQMRATGVQLPTVKDGNDNPIIDHSQIYISTPAEMARVQEIINDPTANLAWKNYNRLRIAYTEAANLEQANNQSPSQQTQGVTKSGMKYTIKR